MDENTQEQNKPVEAAQASVVSAPVAKSGGKRNLFLAILVLIVGAVLISGIFIAAFPSQQEDSSTVTKTESTEVSDISKTADLDTATSEIDETNLDNYQSDLDQIDSDSASF